LGVPYSTLTAKEIEDQYHFRNLPDNYTGLFQPDGASINFKATIETLLNLCRKEETVQLEENSPVLQITPKGELFEVLTPNGIYIAKKLAIIRDLISTVSLIFLILK
jgi:glycine/D-amino acid oxidase-like deaminating enzyme